MDKTLKRYKRLDDLPLPPQLVSLGHGNPPEKIPLALSRWSGKAHSLRPRGVRLRTRRGVTEINLLGSRGRKPSMCCGMSVDQPKI